MGKQKSKFEELLKGGDLRSIGKSNKIAVEINGQEVFDELFKQLYNKDRIVIMRAADVIEKITIKHSEYLRPHKRSILSLCETGKNIELKWHLALLLPRLTLTRIELEKVWKQLSIWATDKTESKIVRVNSLQGLYNLSTRNKNLTEDLKVLVAEIKRENIPSINARIKKLRLLQ